MFIAHVDNTVADICYLWWKLITYKVGVNSQSINQSINQSISGRSCCPTSCSFVPVDWFASFVVCVFVFYVFYAKSHSIIWSAG